FLEAAARQHVRDDVLQAAREAVRQFDRLVEVHAGKRADLEMMLMSCSAAGRREANRAQRRAAFDANSHIWGVQAQTQLAAYFMHPSAGADRVDIAALRGFHGLRRNRPDVHWIVGRARCVEGDGAVRPAPGFTPLDEGVEPRDGTAVPLVREYCSQPLPRVQRVLGENRYLEDELTFADVGDTGRTTCVTGEIARACVAKYRDEKNQTGMLNIRLRTPVETLLLDLFVHEGTGISLPPDFQLYGDLNREGDAYERSERERLPIDEPLQHLGRAMSATYSPQVPRYTELVEWVYQRLGWRREEFDLYRVRLEFPVIPSSARFFFNLPHRPA
ncbi:MAG: hypothetical protein ACF8NJ_09105, partial [Phycisphaerales bacterium JB038]